MLLAFYVFHCSVSLFVVVLRTLFSVFRIVVLIYCPSIIKDKLGVRALYLLFLENVFFFCLVGII